MADRKHVPEPFSEERQRFMRKVDINQSTGCWEWKGTRNSRGGYGLFFFAGATRRAHRLMYVWTYGEPNTDLHHRCENPGCVNPDHLQPVGQEFPVHRHKGPSKSMCAHGHEFTPENTHIAPTGQRVCRTCKRVARAEYIERNRDKENARKRELRVQVQYDPRPCKNCGTIFTPERSTGVFCKRVECWNVRQRLNSLRRQGRSQEA